MRPNLLASLFLALLVLPGCHDPAEASFTNEFETRDCELTTALDACFERSEALAVDRDGVYRADRFNVEAIACTTRYQEVCGESSAFVGSNAQPLVDLATCVTDAVHGPADCLQIFEAVLGSSYYDDHQYLCGLEFEGCAMGASSGEQTRDCELELWSCAARDWSGAETAETCDALREALERDGDLSLVYTHDFLFECYLGSEATVCRN